LSLYPLLGIASQICVREIFPPRSLSSIPEPLFFAAEPPKFPVEPLFFAQEPPYKVAMLTAAITALTTTSCMGYGPI